ncbi:hypothetical protein Avbf_17169 [Armadillidium vulgare]|nr:hypothetical protein Avbf_17169 [Armadillidium vulgare]
MPLYNLISLKADSVSFGKLDSGKASQDWNCSQGHAVLSKIWTGWSKGVIPFIRLQWLYNKDNHIKFLCMVLDELFFASSQYPPSKHISYRNTYFSRKYKGKGNGV